MPLRLLLLMWPQLRLLLLLLVAAHRRSHAWLAPCCRLARDASALHGVGQAIACRSELCLTHPFLFCRVLPSPTPPSLLLLLLF